MTRQHRGKHARPSSRYMHRLAIILAALTISLGPSIAVADAGIDNASYQGCYDAAQVKAAGAAFSFTKITESTQYVNPYATCQIQANRQAGIRLGAYGYARPETGASPEAEADYFNTQSAIRGLVHAGVIPVLDWEPPAPYNRDSGWAMRWLQRVESYWGVKPLIYMQASNIKAADWRGVVSGDYGLWVAGYPRGYAGDKLRHPGAPPYDLSPWSFAAAWQYSSSGHVAGIGTAVDVNWWYGDAVTWLKYAGAPIGTSSNPVTPSKPDSRPVADTQALATAVIRGDYGNDPRRRELLGDKYAAVMDIVNARLSGSRGSGDYIVQPGDTLSGIFGAGWPIAARINGKTYPYTIYVGESLRRPASAQNGYRVQPGDTLSSIATSHGIRQDSIRGYRSGNPNLIYAGEMLYW